MLRATPSAVVSTADAELRRLTVTTPRSSQRLQLADWSTCVHGDVGRSCTSASSEVSRAAVNSFGTGVDTSSSIDEEHLEYERPVTVRRAVQSSSATPSAAVDFSIHRILNLDDPRPTLRPSTTTNVKEAVEEIADLFNARREDDFGPVVEDRPRSPSDKNDDESCIDDKSIAKSGGVRNRQNYPVPIGVPFLPGWLLVAGWNLQQQQQHHFGSKQLAHHQHKSTDRIADSIDHYSITEARQQWRPSADTRNEYLRPSLTPDSAERFAAVDNDPRCSNDSEMSASTVDPRLAGRGSLIGRLPPAEYDGDSSFDSEGVEKTYRLNNCIRSISTTAPSGERKKKSRTVFSRGQIVQLESTFLCHRYPSSVERCRLAADLQLSETQVKIWFQNRRNKWKRQLAIEMETAESFAETAASTVTWTHPNIQSLMAITSALYSGNVHGVAATAAVMDSR